MIRRRQTAQLVPSLLRALPRTQLAAGVSAAFVIAWLLSAEPDSPRTILALQAAALMLSLALASILDDPATDTLAAIPPTLLFRRALTIALALPAILAAWAAIVLLSRIAPGLAGALTLQLSALILMTLALAATLDRGGAVAGPLVVLMFLATRSVAPQWALTPALDDWRWDTTWIGVTTGALLALTLVSRDPAHRLHLRANNRHQTAPAASQ